MRMPCVFCMAAMLTYSYKITFEIKLRMQPSFFTNMLHLRITLVTKIANKKNIKYLFGRDYV